MTTVVIYSNRHGWTRSACAPVPSVGGHSESVTAQPDILRWPTDIVMGSYYTYDPVTAAVGEWIEWLAAAYGSNPPPVGGLAPEPLDQE